MRIGFVKISENYPGGELVLAYLSRGDYFGEIGLLGGGVRTATCTALDHVEVVRISGDDFRTWWNASRACGKGLEAVAAERRAANQQRMQMVHSVPIDQFLVARIDGSAEFADSGFAELHAMRCVRECLRGCA